MEYQFVIPVETASGVKLTFTSKGVERLRELGEKGLAPKEIAERLGAHPTTVARKLTEMGVRRPWALSATPWNDKSVALLKKLYDEGLSCGNIAKQIGGGLTRNAVIGKVHRLGLTARGSSYGVREAKVRKARAARSKVARPVKASSALRWGKTAAEFAAEAEPFEVSADELVIPMKERKTIETLTACSCRWPIGEPQAEDFHFCGKTKVKGLPYCEFHALRAFQPPQPRKRKINHIPSDNAGIVSADKALEAIQ